MKTQCCVCRRIRWGAFWVHPWKSAREASHTYCPRCARATREDLNLAHPVPARWRLGTILRRFQEQDRLGRFHSDFSSDSTF